MFSHLPVLERIITNVERVIEGKRSEIELTLLALLCEGHVLVEDVPGVGKTMLAKSIARSIGCSFKRIQFTPDLLPSDVTGVSIFNQKAGEFEFRPGPIMANIVLADEINRATPKTQAALLECMEEKQVTVDGVTHHLNTPFIVFATQNPIEYEGTFPLPEAQLDRFLMRICLGYPGKEAEIAILDRREHADPLDAIDAVVSPGELSNILAEVKNVYVDSLVKEYIVSVVRATRKHPSIQLGASPRGSLALLRAAQARAIVTGRNFVIPDDIKNLAGPVLAHRILLGSAAQIRNISENEVIQEVLETVAVPGATVRG